MEKIKVLYVEDEPFLARVVKESLESREFEVNLVTDGSLATQAFDDFKPQICVLDVMLPKKDGYTIAREIREKSPDIPLIFLTAKTQTSDLITGFDAGGNDYLKKPFSIEELIIRMHNLLQLTSRFSKETPAANKNDDEIKLGKYTFRPRRFELSLDVETRKLSQRETQLLQMLTGNGENPVMRQEILMKLWGDDSFYNSRNLDVYISRLRDYLSADKTIQIITLKGVGYRFTKD
jgi:DNA-binding response OmpR family regulator